MTTVFRIDATIRILPPPSPVASSSGAAPVTRVDSAATEGEDELPTFADAMASSSTTLGGAVTVVAETSDAGAELVYEQVPQEVALRSMVRSTGGSVIRVKHGETYEGSFTVSFSPVFLLAQQNVDILSPCFPLLPKSRPPAPSRTPLRSPCLPVRRVVAPAPFGTTSRSATTLQASSAMKAARTKVAVGP